MKSQTLSFETMSEKIVSILFPLVRKLSLSYSSFPPRAMLVYRHLLIQSGANLWPRRYEIQNRPGKSARTPKKRIDTAFSLDDAPGVKEMRYSELAPGMVPLMGDLHDTASR